MDTDMSYTLAKARGRVAQAANSIARQFLDNYREAATITGVKPADLILPLVVRESGARLDVKFAEFAQVLDEYVDIIHDATEAEAEDVAEILVREIRSIAIRGVE